MSLTSTTTVKKWAHALESRLFIYVARYQVASVSQTLPLVLAAARLAWASADIKLYVFRLFIRVFLF